MHAASHQQAHGRRHYVLLLVMTVLSFAAMYLLMYAMVDRRDNVMANWNQVYMAGLMTGAMVVIELLVMRFMYPSKAWNVLLAGLGLAAAVACFVFIRRQAAISDRQFVKSMIPHHAAALLMCEQTSLADPELQELCRTIQRTQQAEIDQMKAILARLDG